MASILAAHDFAVDFPEAVVAEADAIPDKPDMRRARGRADLRGERIFTIDGDSSKDFDDAVSITRLDEKINDKPDQALYRLGVHIADVAAYVARGSALDTEALRRGTSLYYADRVAPMLPQNLSNGVCSLNPHTDRFTLTVYMLIDGDGEVVSYEIFESVINSCERMTYKNVYRILEERDPELRERYSHITGDLELMRGLADILRKRRLARGSLDFVTREAVITLDEKDKPIDVKAYEITFANEIIEEFMIACNETVAKHISKANLPFIYRTHGSPDPEKLAGFLEAAAGLGLYKPSVKKAAGPGRRIAPYDLQQILAASRERGCDSLISLIMLRAMAKAAYTPENIGHFGLASECYCHFTSPIRRYPDLLIHRIIKAYIKRGGMSRAEREFYGGALGALCEHCSERERAADETEREVESLKKAEYMKRFLGAEFTGVISGVTSFGMFVELENTVEGLILLSHLPDYYFYDSRLLTLTGELSGDKYKIGDAVDVVLTRADPVTRQIDFSFAYKKAAPRAHRGR